MIKKSTYMLAYEACETYFSETGNVPTIETIKPIININSPTTISSAIKDWKKNLPETLHKSQFHFPAIPEPLAKGFINIWEQALSEARNTLNDQAIGLEKKQTELINKEKLLDGETCRIQQLVKLTEEKYQEEANYLKKEINRLTIENQKLIELNEHSNATVNDMTLKDAVLNEKLQQEQFKFSRLEHQYSKEHEWSLKRINEEKSNYKQLITNEMERLKTDAIRSKRETEFLQSKLDALTNQVNENQNIIIELERKISSEKLIYADLKLKEIELTKELYLKKEQLLILSKKNNKSSKQKKD